MWTRTLDHKVSYSIPEHQIPGKIGNTIQGTGWSSAHLGTRAVVPISDKMELQCCRANYECYFGTRS